MTETQKKGKKCVYNTCDAVTFIVVCCSLIMSIVCTLNTNKTWINKTLWAYSIPLRDSRWSVAAGKVVSVDRDSTISVGGGFSMYRDMKLPTKELYSNVKACGLSDFVGVAVFNGGLKASSYDFEDYVHDGDRFDLPLTKEEKLRTIDEVVCLDRSHVLVVGGGEILPVTVNYTFVDHSLKFKITAGQVFQFAAGYDSYPHIDTMGKDSFCVTFEGKSDDDSLYTFVGTLTGDAETASVGNPSIVKYSEKYSYHKITGLRHDDFVVVAAGKQVFHNHTHEAIMARYIHYNREAGTLSMGNWTTVPHASTTTFFAVDNLDESHMIIVYYNEFGNDGMIAQLMSFDPSSSSLTFGGNLVLRPSQGVTNLERLKMKILSPSRFGVFYDDIATVNSQSLSVVQAIMSDSGELRLVGSPILIVEARRQPWQFVYYDIAMLNFERFVLIESYSTGRDTYASVSLGVQKYMPIGITSESFFGGAKVNFGGLYYAPDGVTFTPGHAYYTDSRGNLIRGEPFGWNNPDMENSRYIVDRKNNVVLSTNNLIDIINTKHCFYLKFEMKMLFFIIIL
ncbi:hypothetical protein WA158_000997 [Blastocystis sp. Blastoise]